jgi:hypothetical protein
MQANSATTPVEKVLGCLEDYKEHRDEFRARCPVHSGTSNNSLSIKEGDDGRALIFCHADCDREDIVEALGLTMADLFASNGHTGYTAIKSPKTNDEPTGKPRNKLPRGVYWEFTLPAGEVLYIQRHRGAYYRRVGEDRWATYPGVLKDISQVLYRLPELIEGVRSGETIYHLEGPKDVETARERLGVVATTSGSTSSWKPEFKSHYIGADVVIVPDNDKPGHKYAQTVANDLVEVSKSVRVAYLPGLEESQDLTDWLDAGHTSEEFFAVVKEAKAYSRQQGNSANYANYAKGNQNKNEEPEEWTPPAAFHSFELPDFPRDVFPSWMSDYTEALSEATQTPRDLAGMLGITVGAVVSAKLVQIEVWGGWTEPANLFTATALKSGSRKTTVFERMCAPIEEYEAQLIEDTAQEIAEQRTRYRVYEGRLKKAEQRAAKSEGDDLDTLTADAMQAASDLESIKVPAEPRLLVDDASPERLAALIAEQGGRIALMSAEGGVFDMMAGRYSQGIPNLDVYLKGHAGDALRVDRVGRAADFVRKPTLTTGLAVQPDVLRGLASKPGFRGRGLLGRYQYAIPHDTLGSRRIRTRPVPRDIENEYGRKVRYILGLSPKLPDGEREPHTLRFSSEAQDGMERLMSWLEPRLADGAEFGDMTDWAGKLAGAVARTAGILHMLDHAGKMEPWEREVSADTFRRAVKIGRYLIPHAKYALAFMGSDPMVEDARYILRWIERGALEWFTKREAFEGTKQRFGKVSELEPALELLTAHGYIREDPNQPHPRGPGRKPSPRYEVNPLIEGGIKPEHPSHNSHNSQNREGTDNGGLPQKCTCGACEECWEREMPV